MFCKSRKTGVHFDTACPNERRDKFESGFQGVPDEMFYRFTTLGV